MPSQVDEVDPPKGKSQPEGGLLGGGTRIARGVPQVTHWLVEKKVFPVPTQWDMIIAMVQSHTWVFLCFSPEWDFLLFFLFLPGMVYWCRIVGGGPSFPQVVVPTGTTLTLIA